MSAMSDALENSLIDHCLRGISFAAPTALWVSLLTAAPSDSGGGTEVAGGGYARVSYPPTATNWANTQNSGTGASSGSSGTTSNTSAITFAAPTANWGTITHFGLYSAASGGTLYWWGPLTASKTVNNGDAAPSFQPGALSIQIDN